MPLKEDPIIAEVHRTRRKIFKECGNNISVYIRHLKDLEKARTSQTAADKKQKQKA